MQWTINLTRKRTTYYFQTYRIKYGSNILNSLITPFRCPVSSPTRLFCYCACSNAIPLVIKIIANNNIITIIHIFSESVNISNWNSPLFCCIYQIYRVVGDKTNSSRLITDNHSPSNPESKVGGKAGFIEQQNLRIELIRESEREGVR